jgi:thiol-disulfide isomerase/thioredoxin
VRIGGILAVVAALFLALPAVAADEEVSVFKETAGRPAAPELTVIGLDEAPASLSAYKGKLVLLNLWATWCAPCVKEMPALLRLQQKMGPEGLQVVALSQDRGSAHVVKPFLAEKKLSELTVLLDPKSTTMKAMQIRGLPTTILISRDGKEIGRMEGDYEWDGPEAIALIQKHLR